MNCANTPLNLLAVLGRRWVSVIGEEALAASAAAPSEARGGGPFGS